jgi:adenylate cyclase
MTPTILVVDDEPDLKTLVTQKFRRQIRKGEFISWLLDVSCGIHEI